MAPCHRILATVSATRWLTTPQVRGLFPRSLRYTHTAAQTVISQPLQTDEIDNFFSAPAWNIRGLFSHCSDVSTSPDFAIDVSPAKLHHLLRLSALPPPLAEAEETRMLQDLARQIHVVRQIQLVDEAGIEPLARLEDETVEAKKENQVNLETMKEELNREIWRGRWNRRVLGKQLPATGDRRSEGEWDVLRQAQKRIGRFFVVEGDKHRPQMDDPSNT